MNKTFRMEGMDYSFAHTELKNIKEGLKKEKINSEEILAFVNKTVDKDILEDLLEAINEELFGFENAYNGGRMLVKQAETGKEKSKELSKIYQAIITKEAYINTNRTGNA